jgi:hypothetical protein
MKTFKIAPSILFALALSVLVQAPAFAGDPVCKRYGGFKEYASSTVGGAGIGAIVGFFWELPKAVGAVAMGHTAGPTETHVGRGAAIGALAGVVAEKIHNNILRKENKEAGCNDNISDAEMEKRMSSDVLIQGQLAMVSATASKLVPTESRLPLSSRIILRSNSVR